MGISGGVSHPFDARVSRPLAKRARLPRPSIELESYFAVGVQQLQRRHDTKPRLGFLRSRQMTSSLPELCTGGGEDGPACPTPIEAPLACQMAQPQGDLSL